MRGSSQPSYEAVAQGVEPVLAAAGAEAAVLGDQLFAVVDALDGSGSLRRALTDPSRSPEDKAALAAGLLRGRVDERVVETVQGLARGRWAAEADLVDSVERLAVHATLAAAQNEGRLDQVEDELFRLDRILVGQRELRTALTDARADGPARRALVRRLLDGKVHGVTLRLAERIAAQPRGRGLQTSLSLLGDAAAERRRLLVAEVTSASPLSLVQQDRLAAILTRSYGRPVKVNLAVDPQVVGGLKVEVGPEVVDATVASRLDDVRRRLAG